MSDQPPNLPTIEHILQNPGTSYWLCNAIESSLKRDPVDAAGDAKLLSLLLARRCDEILKSFTPC
jgi:hypothetical protein